MSQKEAAVARLDELEEGEMSEIITQRGVSVQNFLAFYVREGKMTAAAGMKRDREMVAIEELMRIKQMPSPDELRDGRLNLLELFS